MAKLALFPLLLALACGVAGLYGMLHNTQHGDDAEPRARW